jgi:arginine/lysine/ornithine decarboxylase
MDRTRQQRAPIVEALRAVCDKRIVPFDVPGHKHGKGNKDLTDLLGEACLRLDMNSMKPLDNLCHPVSVIREAEELAAEAFGAQQAFFMVNGTTSAVQAMILSVCKQDEKIILPRNVHRSVINALVLNGAAPVYINPQINQRLGISLGMTLSDVRQAMDDHPEAKAVLLNNPTYYGICSNLPAITQLAHSRGMLVIVDEAHGTHLGFGDDLPCSAMQADADLAAISMHKSGGSLTQSSLLLCGRRVNARQVRQIINLTQTTSGSYLLLASLDLSRRLLALRGDEIFAKVTDMAQYARSEINQIGDYYAYGRELINGDTIFDFDPTKLAVNTLDLGLAGIEVYNLLRDEYDIQIEFGDIGNILAYLSMGDRIQDLERLVGALSEIRRRYRRDRSNLLDHEYVNPRVAVTPQTAFYAARSAQPLESSEGRICAEFVMSYPPGIPILAPGEVITAEIIRTIQYAREKGCSLTGTEDPTVQMINVIR